MQPKNAQGSCYVFDFYFKKTIMKKRLTNIIFRNHELIYTIIGEPLLPDYWSGLTAYVGPYMMLNSNAPDFEHLAKMSQSSDDILQQNSDLKSTAVQVF